MGVVAADVDEAERRISGYAVRTPVIRAHTLSEHLHADIYLKLELTQPTGSFKVRGVANHMLAHPADTYVTYSTGNHGLAVAHLAQRLGKQAIICVGGDTAASKLEALRRTGAEVRVTGTSQNDAAIAAAGIAHAARACLIPPFDDPYVIAGQGTIAKEIADQLPSVDTVIVPVSGGGLISGVGVTAKALSPSIRIVGACATRASAMWESQRAGSPVSGTDEPTLADSLRGGLGVDNRFTFGMVSCYVDELVCVTEDAVADGIVYALRYEGLVIEGAAAVTIGALLAGTLRVQAGRTVLVLTGRNVSVDQVFELDHQRPDPVGRRPSGGEPLGACGERAADGTGSGTGTT